MRIGQLLFGRRLSDAEASAERLRVASGIPVLGLDALASAAYGPEAALTVLRALGAAGIGYVGPISATIIVLLRIVQVSYRQTISAYRDGGGSYTVSKENLGHLPSLLAAAALFVDYVLNVAVAIAAGVGALTSALPGLHRHTLVLCLALLALLTLTNLRGLRTAGLLFMVPTYLFVASLLAVTDRLIPLFAIGAFLAFTLSQAGMVIHWLRRRGEPHARKSLTVNLAGARSSPGPRCS